MSDLPPPSPAPDIPPPSTPEIPPASVAPQPPVVSAFDSAPSSPPIGDSPVTGPTPKDGEEKTLGMVMHLLPLAGLVLTFVHIPLLNLIAPGVLWFVKKDKSPYLDAVGKEVLNFQITATLAGLVCVLLIPVFCIGLVLGIALMVVCLYYIVLAAIAANKGEFYRFPYCLRLIK